jgi:hypothetical protein
MSDVVEYILGGTILVVLDDGQYVRRLQVSLLFCPCEKCHTTGMPSANVAHPLDEEGFCVVGALQPVDGLEICIEPVSFSPNHGLVVILQVEVIGDGVTGTHPLHHFVAQMHATKVFEQCLRSFDYLDNDHGHNLLRKTVPSAHNNPLRRLHLHGMWMEWDRSHQCVCLYSAGSG